ILDVRVPDRVYFPFIVLPLGRVRTSDRRGMRVLHLACCSRGIARAAPRGGPSVCKSRSMTTTTADAAAVDRGGYWRRVSNWFVRVPVADPVDRRNAPILQ